MKTLPNFKIVVLDDDDFYNKLLTKQIDSELNELKKTLHFNFEINSYTSCKDCAVNFDTDTTLLFSDFYLGNGYNASYLMELIKQRSSDCKVVIVSQLQNTQTALSTLLNGAYEFFQKDPKLLHKCGELASFVIAENLKHKKR